MAERDAILEDFESQIGKEALPQPARFEVEKGTMMKVAWAAGDLNPLWWDEKYARQTRYGGLIASPIFVEWFVLRYLWPSYRDTALDTRKTLFAAGGAHHLRNVAGGKDVEYFQPMRIGDVITLSQKLKSVKKRWSKTLNTNIYILNDELTLTNQFDELVAIHRNTSMRVS